MNSLMNAPVAAEPLLEVDNLAVEVATRKGSATIIDGIRFNLGRGEALGVVGESGSGKSMTVLSMLGLLPPGAKLGHGQVRFEGRDLVTLPRKEMRKIRGGRIGMIFQDPMTSFNPVMRIGDQLIEPLIYHRRLSRKQAWERAGTLLRLVGIPGGEARLHNYPHELSGGMRQRVMIATAMACEPSLLIADEPTTALDVTIQAQIVDIMKDTVVRQGTSLIWITHDLALIAGLVDRIIVLYSGRIVEEAPVEDLYARPTHPYTRGLLASLPRVEGAQTKRLASIRGTPPDPDARPPGCPFAPRCDLRIARCMSEQPPLVPVRSGEQRHRAACWVTTEITGNAS